MPCTPCWAHLSTSWSVRRLLLSTLSSKAASKANGWLAREQKNWTNTCSTIPSLISYHIYYIIYIKYICTYYTATQIVRCVYASCTYMCIYYIILSRWRVIENFQTVPFSSSWGCHLFTSYNQSDVPNKEMESNPLLSLNIPLKLPMSIPKLKKNKNASHREIHFPTLVFHCVPVFSKLHLSFSAPFSIPVPKWSSCCKHSHQSDEVHDSPPKITARLYPSLSSLTQAPLVSLGVQNRQLGHSLPPILRSQIRHVDLAASPWPDMGGTAG